MRRTPLVLFTAAVLGPVSAVPAAVLVVDAAGSGAFTDIPAAVFAAADGDIVLVQSGTYNGFVIGDKSIVITADAGAVCQVLGQVGIQGVTASRQVALSGLDIDANSGGTALLIQNCDGPVLVENAQIVGSGFPILQTNVGAIVTNSAQVTFVGCALSVAFGSGFYPGLRASSSNVALYESSVQAGAQTIETLPGVAGCELQSGFLFASGSAFLGGSGGAGALTFPFMTCIDGGDGGPGLALGSGAPVAKVLDCAFLGGPGGAAAAPNCNGGANGPGQSIASGSIQTFPHPARTYDIPSPVREGGTGFITLNGFPGDFAWLLFSVNQSPSYADSLKGTLLPGLPQIVLFVGALPPSGTVTFNVPVPVNPSLASVALIEQAVYYTATNEFQVSNPRLGVVLDQSL